MDCIDRRLMMMVILISIELDEVANLGVAILGQMKESRVDGFT